MTALLFVWNPDKWHWADMDAAESATRAGDVWPMAWSTGIRRHFEIGERLYLMRQHRDRGIVAAGIVHSFPKTGPYWDGTAGTQEYVDIVLDSVTSTALPVGVLAHQVKDVAWDRLQSSGVRVSRGASVLGDLWTDHLRGMGRTPPEIGLSGEEQGARGALVEGAVREITVLTYERNPVARRACLEHYGNACSVCEIDFGSVYGDLGQGFIHVHHICEISSIGEDYVVDPLTDLRPVCPNCHAMLHRERPPLSIEALKKVMRRAAE